MPRYHFNPATGRPSICKATKDKCPFVAEGARHYDSKEEARAGIEQFYTESYTSLAGRLIVQRNRIQREIIDRSNAGEDWPTLRPLCKERDQLDDLIAELKPASDEETPKLSTKPMKMLHGPLNNDKGDEIVGFSNKIEGLQATSKETADAVIAISEEWVSKLKTEEVQVLHEYTGNTAMAVNHRETFDKALRKSPPLEPTIVYSGLSKYVGNDVVSQLDSGIIDLDYPISTSLNAAQVNGFMRDLGGDAAMSLADEERDLVAVEIETTTGAPLAAITSNPHEFEVLLPSGSYEVIGVRKNVTMSWNEGGSGRMANRLIQLRRLA